ncbi:cytosolic sulfotransferase 15-like [Vicia villosa]|uniref:cytosolic sulfotransferase 15-like n=1 Tax=Vicia villosa TaxID=3911 RepID=UPI00273BFAB2|nr:cytosolic sulfotransferase 15-like [Vicia villosa]
MASTKLIGNQSRDEQDQARQEEDQQLILSLPKENGWMPFEYYYYFQGFWCPSDLIQSVNSFQKYFLAKDNDVIVSSLPKAGTTWMKALTFAIVNRNNFPSFDDHPLLKSISHDLVPYFEFNVYGTGDICDRFPQVDSSKMIEPRIFGTHIPFHSLAKSIKKSNCKIIYISRNPFDNFVSAWFFANKARSNHQSLQNLSLEEAFENYCKGITPFGSFWDHNLGYLNESIIRSEKVLFLKYENLREEPILYVNKIADFLGFPFTREEKNNKVIENIIDLCDFEKMKELEVNKSETLMQNIDNKFFFRKAQVGDWRNYFSSLMEEKLSKVVEEKLGGSKIKLEWPLHTSNK